MRSHRNITRMFIGMSPWPVMKMIEIGRCVPTLPDIPSLIDPKPMAHARVHFSRPQFRTFEFAFVSRQKWLVFYSLPDSGLRRAARLARELNNRAENTITNANNMTRRIK